MKIENTLVIKAETGERLFFSKTSDKEKDYRTAYKKLLFKKDAGILTVIAETIDGVLLRSTHSIKWNRIGHSASNPGEIFFYRPSGRGDLSIIITRNVRKLELTYLAQEISRFVFGSLIG